MGYKYEVFAWVPKPGGHSMDDGSSAYQWWNYYSGNSFIRAILAIMKAKKTSKRVKLEM